MVKDDKLLKIFLFNENYKGYRGSDPYRVMPPRPDGSRLIYFGKLPGGYHMKSINAFSPVEAQKDQKTRYFYPFRPDLLDLLDLLDFAGTGMPLFLYTNSGNLSLYFN